MKRKKNQKQPNVYVSFYHIVLIALALIGIIGLSVNIGYKRGLDQCGKGEEFKILFPFAQELQVDEVPKAEPVDAYDSGLNY